jgi:integrase/recombinase XerD
VAEHLDRPVVVLRLGEVVDEYLLDRERNLSHETVRSYRSVLLRFADHAGRDVRLERVTAEHIDTFVKEGGLASSTQRLRFRIVRAFMNHCEKRGTLSNNSVRAVEAPRPEARLPKAITREELAAICEALMLDYEHRLKAKTTHPCKEGDLVWMVPMMWFALYTGLRISELARLRWKHLDLVQQRIYVYKQKARKESIIPLTSAALAVLEQVERLDEDDFVFQAPRFRKKERTVRAFKNRVTRIFRRYRERAGVRPEITFHSLRHGFCTILAEAGKPAYVIKEAARHAHISTSLLYVSLTNQHLHNEVEDAFSAHA